jgi:tetratricopeptide (TPR) repeat protein
MRPAAAGHYAPELPVSRLQRQRSRMIPRPTWVLSSALVLGCLSFGILPSVLAQPAPRVDPANREHLHVLLEQGKSLAAEGRIAEAERPLLEAAQLVPDDFETLTILAEVQGRIGRSAEAIERFRKIVSLYPRVADSHLNLGIALADVGQLEEALKETSKAIALAPRMTSAHVNRARVLDDLRRVPEAESEFAIAYKLDPKNPDCLYYSALVERESGNLNKEAELLQKLVVVQPDNYKAAYALGRSLQEQSRDEEAIKALRQALAIKPDYQEALYLLSRELRKSTPEESRQLDEQFQAVRQRQSTLDSSESLGNEAFAAAGRKDWPEAIRLLRKALDICGQCEASAGLHKNLGLALCRNGNVSEGRTELETSLKLNPNDPDVVKALNVIGR